MAKKDGEPQKSNETGPVNVIVAWLRRNFSDPGALSLFIVLCVVLFLIEFFGSVLAPILVSIVIAYMLHALVVRLQRWRVKRFVAVVIVFTFFIALLVVALIWLLPLLSKQMFALINQIPASFARAKVYLDHLVHLLPESIAPSQLQHVMSLFQAQFSQAARYIVSFSLATIPGLITAVLYLVLVPVMVFFFLKNSTSLMIWGDQFLPENRQAIDKVWGEVHTKIGQYIKGRLFEIMIVTIVAWIAFYFLGLSYALLLASILGVSAIVPYIGAVIATIPVVVVGLMQWGMSAHFLYLMIVYTTIVFLDANILVPLLFAETMDLHPLAIIIAILLFGGVWGFWGVFFAIPLATLAKSILNVWKQKTHTAFNNSKPPLLEDKGETT